MANVQVVFQPLKRVVLVEDPYPAGIVLQEPIIVPAGENPTSDATFVYNVGNPVADMWMVEFFASEADAEADRNALTDVDEFLAYTIHPASPVSAGPRVRQDGYLRLTRLAAIPYGNVCLKLSICQPDSERLEKKGDAIRKAITPLQTPRRRHHPKWEQYP